MLKKTLIVLVCFSFLLTGCQGLFTKNLLAEEIVETAMEKNEEMEDYYIESLIEIYNNDKLLGESTIKEWNMKIDGEIKRMSEVYSEEVGRVISTFQEDQIIMYSEMENEVYRNRKSIDMAPEGNLSIKERTQNDLDTLNEMHTMEIVGEEELNGIETYHIKGSPEEESKTLGDYEIWIDKKNWVVVKVISDAGDIKFTYTNTKIDLSPEIDPSIFNLDIPDDAKEINLDEINEFEEVTLDQAYKELEENLLVVKDEDYKLEKIEINNPSGPNQPKPIIFTYTKDEIKAFEISVFYVLEEGMLELDELMGFEKREIRGKQASVMDNIIKMINFEEDENYYVFMIDNPETTVDRVIEVINNMEQYK